MARTYDCTEYTVVSEQLPSEHTNKDRQFSQNSPILLSFPTIDTWQRLRQVRPNAASDVLSISEQSFSFRSRSPPNHKEFIRPALVLRYYTSRHVGPSTLLFVPLQGDAVQTRRQWSAPGGPGGAQDPREAATLGRLPGQQ